MQSFNSLNRKELSTLNEQQIDAYIDIELATKNVVKPIEVSIDFPNYLKVADAYPERDLTVYEVDGYTFADVESAQKFASAIGALAQVRKDYDWKIDREVEYAKDVFYATPTVEMKKVYSEAKFTASREHIKAIKERRNKQKETHEEAVDSVIDYEAIDQVRNAVRSRVREAIEFFAKAHQIAEEYNKYFSITNDSDEAFETLFTVYNVQDDELKAQVREDVSAAAV